MSKVVVLHSGGLDSTVCLLLALEAGNEVLSVGINYGQHHLIEMEYAAAQCRRFQVQRKVLNVEWDKPERGVPLSRSLREIVSGVSPAFLPGRNLVLLSLGLAEAAGAGADAVWIGVNSVDFSGYPDCRREFISAFAAVAREAIPRGPAVCAPLIDLGKREIAARAKRLGLGKGETWSCYRPVVRMVSGISPCGECDACVLDRYAWEGEGCCQPTAGRHPQKRLGDGDS